jgi:hypothetical protein
VPTIPEIGLRRVLTCVLQLCIALVLRASAIHLALLHGTATEVAHALVLLQLLREAIHQSGPFVYFGGGLLLHVVSFR